MIERPQKKEKPIRIQKQKKEASKLYRKKKRRYEKEEIQKLESNQIRKFYQGIPKCGNGYTPSSSSELLNGVQSTMTPQKERLVFNSN
uniref:Uncharacterized protein n=1 Tax=Megaselia scalaris TaxID=36166 RepID=T1H4L9_MEGSC